MSARKRLPAYGRALAAERAHSIIPGDTIMVLLDHWGRFKHRRHVVIPSDADLTKLQFKVLSGADVILVFDPALTGEDRKNATIHEITQALPSRLRIVQMGNPPQIISVGRQS